MDSIMMILIMLLYSHISIYSTIEESIKNHNFEYNAI